MKSIMNIKKCICSMFLLSLILCGCKNIFSVSAPESSTVTVKFTAECARSVMPQMEVSQLTEIKIAANNGTENSIMGTWDTYTSLSSVPIEIEEGSYTFTMTAKLNDMNLSGKTTATISETSNTVNFILKFDEYNSTEGKGTVDIKFMLATGINFDLNSVESVLTSIGEPSVEIPFTYTHDEENNMQYVRFTNDHLSSGEYYYSAIFKTDSNKYYKFKDVLFVNADCTTSITKTLTDSMLIPLCKITYNLNCPELNGITETEYFISAEGTTIKNIPSHARDGYLFDGWYTDSNCSGEEVLVIAPFQANENVSFYAKWEKNIIPSKYFTLTPSNYGIKIVLNNNEMNTIYQIVIEDTTNGFIVIPDTNIEPNQRLVLFYPFVNEGEEHVFNIKYYVGNFGANAVQKETISCVGGTGDFSVLKPKYLEEGFSDVDVQLSSTDTKMKINIPENTDYEVLASEYFDYNKIDLYDFYSFIKVSDNPADETRMHYMTFQISSWSETIFGSIIDAISSGVDLRLYGGWNIENYNWEEMSEKETWSVKWGISMKYKDPTLYRNATYIIPGKTVEAPYVLYLPPEMNEYYGIWHCEEDNNDYEIRKDNMLVEHNSSTGNTEQYLYSYAGENRIKIYSVINNAYKVVQEAELSLSNGELTIKTIENETVTSTIELTSKRKYTISFVTGDNAEQIDSFDIYKNINYQYVDPETMSYSTTDKEYLEFIDLKKINSPVKKGYVFAGWYLDPEYTQPVPASSTEIRSNLTFYAKWKKNPVVTFVSNCDIEIEPMELEYSRKYFITTEQNRIVFYLLKNTNSETYYMWNSTFIDLAKDGSVIEGVYLDPEFSQRVSVDYQNAILPEVDFNLYVKWVPKVILTFETNGGNSVDPIEIPYGEDFYISKRTDYFSEDSDDIFLLHRGVTYLSESVFLESFRFRIQKENAIVEGLYFDENFTQPVPSDFVSKTSITEDKVIYVKWREGFSLSVIIANSPEVHKYYCNKGDYCILSTSEDVAVLTLYSNDGTISHYEIVNNENNLKLGRFYRDPEYTIPIDVSHVSIDKDLTIYVKFVDAINIAITSEVGDVKISVTGNNSSSVLLEADEGFEDYKWYLGHSLICEGRILELPAVPINEAGVYPILLKAKKDDFIYTSIAYVTITE